MQTPWWTVLFIMTLTKLHLSVPQVQGLVRSLYHSFNFVTGYHHEDPPVSAIEYRLILLEAFAGVPGFLAAGFRHFRSLRMLQRDHGFIYSLLEEVPCLQQSTNRGD